MWVTGGVPAPAELAGSIEEQFGTPPSTPSSSGSAASSGSEDNRMTPFDYRLPDLKPRKKCEKARIHEEWDTYSVFYFLFYVFIWIRSVHPKDIIFDFLIFCKFTSAE